MQNKKIIYSNCIPKEKVIKIVKVCEENGIYFTINTENYILSNSLDFNLKYYYYENSRKPKGKKTKIKIIEDIENYIQSKDIGKITKIAISNKNKTAIDGVINKLKEIEKINILEVSNMSKKIIKSDKKEESLEYYYTEITNENVNKWETIKVLAKYLGIKQEEISAIGDNFNDEEMIKNSKLRDNNGKWCTCTQKNRQNNCS